MFYLQSFLISLFWASQQFPILLTFVINTPEEVDCGAPRVKFEEEKIHKYANRWASHSSLLLTQQEKGVRGPQNIEGPSTHLPIQSITQLRRHLSFHYAIFTAEGQNKNREEFQFQ